MGDELLGGLGEVVGGGAELRQRRGRGGGGGDLLTGGAEVREEGVEVRVGAVLWAVGEGFSIDDF